MKADARALRRQLTRVSLELARLASMLPGDGGNTGSAADPVADAADQLRRACSERGFDVSLDDAVTEAAAASLLSRSTQTLRRWRSEGIGPRWRRGLGRRIEYAVADLAVFRAENIGDDE
jgi:hypothetical protein